MWQKLLTALANAFGGALVDKLLKPFFIWLAGQLTRLVENIQRKTKRKKRRKENEAKIEDVKDDTTKEEARDSFSNMP